ncbi:MAG: folylpolyglutamate synthase/dihydrofolate synthase family protein [Negativicutes bacterium]|jgi:dihydrofolate synthase/folylpolyglutamate synthase
MNHSEYTEICLIISSRLSGGSLSADLQFAAMRRLMQDCGNPQDKVPAVHIAGTNGKGSTAAYIYNVAYAAKLKTGLFTSPHLERFNERIAVDGNEINDVDFVRLAKLVLLSAEQLQLALSGFAVLTAMAFLYFTEQGCDLMVIETGLGGRWDATNVISQPLVSVLTAIDYDHVKILGESLAEIALEKCGIIKPGCLVVALRQTVVVNSVIEKEARRNNANLRWCSRADITVINQNLTAQRFSYTDYGALTISLLGDYQLTNALAALLAVEAVNQSGKLKTITREAICCGLSTTRWPGRLEVIVLPNHTIIIDGAHNPQGAGMLADFVNANFMDAAAVIFGSLRTKDTGSVIECLSSIAASICTVSVDNPLALTAEQLRELFLKSGKTATACSSLTEAFTVAMAQHRLIVICGSLYLIAEARQLVTAMLKGSL